MFPSSPLFQSTEPLLVAVLDSVTSVVFSVPLKWLSGVLTGTVEVVSGTWVVVRIEGVTEVVVQVVVNWTGTTVVVVVVEVTGTMLLVLQVVVGLMVLSFGGKGQGSAVHGPLSPVRAGIQVVVVPKGGANVVVSVQDRSKALSLGREGVLVGVVGEVKVKL
jgi:hypothetical protein